MSAKKVIPLSPSLHAIGENELIRRIAEWMAPRTASPHSATSTKSTLSTASTKSIAESTKTAAKRPPWAKQEILVAIGDDTAIVRQSRGAPPLAITTDMLVEGTHFLPSQPPESLGKKAGNCNLSDLAAVGAWPAWVLVSLGAPGKTSTAWIEAFYRGLRSVLDPFGCLCVGGDCVRAERVTINIVAGGSCASDTAPPLRSRAKPGQDLYVTGTLGDSGAGLFLLRHPRKEKELRAAGVNTAALIARHQEAASRIHAGIAIARRCRDAAMMDLSDGLAADLPRMAGASGCGFEVSAAVLPLSAALRRFAARAGLSADLGRRDARPNSSGRRDARSTLADFALFGGEDYELVFTTGGAPERWRGAVAHAAPGRPLRLTRIGRVVRGSGVRFLDAQGREIRANGSFEHF